MSGEAGRFVLENDLAGKVERIFGEAYARVEGKKVGDMFVLLKTFTVIEPHLDMNSPAG